MHVPRNTSVPLLKLGNTLKFDINTDGLTDRCLKKKIPKSIVKEVLTNLRQITIKHVNSTVQLQNSSSKFILSPMSD